MPKMSARLRDPDLSQNDSGILPTVKMPQGKKKKKTLHKDAWFTMNAELEMKKTKET